MAFLPLLRNMKRHWETGNSTQTTMCLEAQRRRIQSEGRDTLILMQAIEMRFSTYSMEVSTIVGSRSLDGILAFA